MMVMSMSVIQEIIEFKCSNEDIVRQFMSGTTYSLISNNIVNASTPCNEN